MVVPTTRKKKEKRCIGQNVPPIIIGYTATNTVTKGWVNKMCFAVKGRCKIADKDIVCYKVLFRAKEDDEGRTFVAGAPGGNYSHKAFFVNNGSVDFGLSISIDLYNKLTKSVYISLYMGGKYVFNKIVRAKDKEGNAINDLHPTNYYGGLCMDSLTISEGLHSYRSVPTYDDDNQLLDEVICELVIPSGSKYYENDKEYVSLNLRMRGEIS